MTASDYHVFSSRPTPSAYSLSTSFIGSLHLGSEHLRRIDDAVKLLGGDATEGDGGLPQTEVVSEGVQGDLRCRRPAPGELRTGCYSHTMRTA